MKISKDEFFEMPDDDVCKMAEKAISRLLKHKLVAVPEYIRSEHAALTYLFFHLARSYENEEDLGFIKDASVALFRMGYSFAKSKEGKTT